VVDRAAATTLVDRSVETQVGTGELSFGDRHFFTSPCGITTGVLEFYDRTGEERYLAAAEDQIEFVLNAPRVYNGGIWHNKDAPELWVDSLYIMIPPIAQLGACTGDQSLIDEAAAQIVAHAEPLQDDRTGLFRHMWRETPNDYPEGTFWGRGNGWAAAGILDVLEHLPEDYERRDELTAILHNQLEEVVSLQDKSGYWWNVLDDDSTFLETSVTAIFAYVLRRGIDIGLVSESYAENADRAYRAIRNAVNDEGVVTGATYVTTHDPNSQLVDDNVFSMSGYAQGWYLKTVSYFLDD
jgi:unsaturated rhamnogalacturonyl hydrolase